MTVATQDEIVLMSIATAVPPTFGNRPEDVAVRACLPDISKALKRLHQRGLIGLERNGDVALSPGGVTAREAAFGKALPAWFRPF
jgi:hypothetical protein